MLLHRKQSVKSNWPKDRSRYRKKLNRRRKKNLIEDSKNDEVEQIIWIRKKQNKPKEMTILGHLLQQLQGKLAVTRPVIKSCNN